MRLRIRMRVSGCQRGVGPPAAAKPQPQPLNRTRPRTRIGIRIHTRIGNRIGLGIGVRIGIGVGLGFCTPSVSARFAMAADIRQAPTPLARLLARYDRISRTPWSSGRIR